MNKIRKGDEVVVITGKDKGRRGVVKQMIDGGRAIVEGVNMIKKHVKPNPNQNVEGGIVEREASIHVSNLAVFNPTAKKADRVGFKMVGRGKEKKKVRIFKSNQEQINI
jgi:large subunit ribosomal protein L24